MSKREKPQLTHADVKRLYAERRYAEIDAARIDGRLDRVLGVIVDPTAPTNREATR